MISHCFLCVIDFDRALAFCAPLMAVLGNPSRFCDKAWPWAGWQSMPGPPPLLLIGPPFDKLAYALGNGQMFALLVNSRAVIDTALASALPHGDTCEGAPGLRLEYNVRYYDAYFRDPDSDKLRVVCHVPAH